MKGVVDETGRQNINNELQIKNEELEQINEEKLRRSLVRPRSIWRQKRRETVKILFDT